MEFFIFPNNSLKIYLALNTSWRSLIKNTKHNKTINTFQTTFDIFLLKIYQIVEYSA